jgi:hypothetical protein
MTKKTFYYYEVEIPQELRDNNTEMDVAAQVLKNKRREYIENTDSKNAKIIEEFIFSCSAYYYFKEGTNIGAISLEFITDRDWDRHQAAVAELKEYFASIGINWTYEAVRHMDFDGMQVPGENDEPNSYWKTKVYFNETLPKERGFDTVCPLEESDGTMTWVEFWTHEL